MAASLSFEQTRVLGVILEKEKTTPEQYPLSINAIMTACNQKSNREPITHYSELDVQKTVDELMQLRLIDDVPASRTTKYRQRFAGSAFSAYQFNNAEVAILAVLFLRGPQTLGELRTRTQRLHPFIDVNDVETSLQNLASREGEAYIVKLPREAGKRESRFAHQFSGQVDITALAENHSTITSASSASTVDIQNERISQLEETVAKLQTELDNIKQALDL